MTEHPSGNDLDLYKFPGHLIRRLHQISVAQFAEKTSEHGFDLTPVQFAALMAISSNPGIDQATVAGLIAYDKATLGKVIDRLQTKGLVDRTISTKDRRARQLKLTKEGRKTLETIQPLVNAVQDEILIGLTDEEKVNFVQLLNKVTSAGNDLSRAPLRFPSGRS